MRDVALLEPGVEGAQRLEVQRADAEDRVVGDHAQRREEQRDVRLVRRLEPGRRARLGVEHRPHPRAQIGRHDDEAEQEHDHHRGGAGDPALAVDVDHARDEKSEEAAARGRQEQLQHEDQSRRRPEPAAHGNRRLSSEHEGQRDHEHEDRREVVRLVQPDPEPLAEPDHLAQRIRKDEDHAQRHDP